MNIEYHSMYGEQDCYSVAQICSEITRIANANLAVGVVENWAFNNEMFLYNEIEKLVDFAGKVYSEKIPKEFAKFAYEMIDYVWGNRLREYCEPIVNRTDIFNRFSDLCKKGTVRVNFIEENRKLIDIKCYETKQ